MDILDRIRKLPEAERRITAYNTNDPEYPRFKYRGRWYQCYEIKGEISINRYEETRIPKNYITTSTVLMEHIVNSLDTNNCKHEDKQSLFYYDKHVGYYCPDCDKLIEL